MSQQNVEIVRRGFEAYQRGDVASMLESAAPDFITHRAHPAPDAGTYRGRDGFLQAVSEWVEGFDQFEATAEEFIDANDSQVMVRVHQQAVGAESRAPVESTFWFVFTFDGGKLVRLDMYPRKDQALEATGLAR